MTVTYKFANFSDFAEHIENLAERRRQQQEEAKKVSDKREHGAEAMAYEYIADLVRNSNLITAQIIESDDDLQGVLKSIDEVIISLGHLGDDIYIEAQNMKQKRDEVREQFGLEVIGE